MALAGSGNLSDLTKNHRISKDGKIVKDSKYIINSYIDTYFQIGKELEKIDSVTDIDDLLVKFTILQGKLMGKIKSATDPVGEKGKNISVTEKKRYI